MSTDQDWSAAEREIIEDFMRTRDVPGLAIAVVANGQVAKSGGFGCADLANERCPDGHTAWPIASVTKSFTAVAALQCVEAGLLDLDAPVTDYLPNALVVDADTTARLTMRRLLTHTSGIGRSGHQDRTREESLNPYPTRVALVAALHEVQPQAPVGQCFSYSNESYALAGHLIETVRGIPLERCFQEFIFDAVGMIKTSPSLGAWRQQDNRAYLYAGRDIGPYGSGQQHAGYEVVELVQDYQTFLSTGGIASTAHDLALYQCATMDFEHSKLGLSGGTLDHMQSVQHPFGDSGWGYGLGYWVMRSGATRVIGHSGGLPGVSTYSLMIPSENAGVVVLTNRSDIKAMVLAERLMGLARGQLWRAHADEPLPITSAWAAPSSTDLQPYLGDYVFRRGPACVHAGTTGIVLRTPSRYDGPVVEIETRRVARDRFACLNDGHVIDFVRDANNIVSGLIHSGYCYQRQS